MVNLNPVKGQYKTAQTKKMNINGKQEIMTVYRIPLDLLYYNDQNDRIATYISKYNADRDVKLSDLPVEQRNELIEKYIIDSDQDKFVRTRDNIRNLSQMEPGVVLSDGRVIDGNRRFTCLRALHRETGDQQFNFFETVILDTNITEKQIKIMELILQHGKDEKVDYNPIEKLVGIYRDIVKDKKLTIEEYARSIDVKKSIVEKSVELAKLMEDFLEYDKSPEKFYIAKELEIDGPLNEIYLIKKKIGSDEETWNHARTVLYNMILTKTKNNGSADITRTIREFGKTVIPNKRKFLEFIDKHREISKKIHKKIEECEGELTPQYIRDEIRNDTEIADAMTDIVESSIYDGKKQELQHLPIEQLKGINDDLSKLDITAVSRLQGDIKKEFIEQLNLIQRKINQINDRINNGIN